MPCGRRRRRGAAAGLGCRLLAFLAGAAAFVVVGAGAGAASTTTTPATFIIPAGGARNSGGGGGRRGWSYPHPPVSTHGVLPPRPASGLVGGGSRTALRLSLRAFDLGSLTVDQLRDALRRRGLKTGGKKDELLARLRGDIQRAQQEERGLMMQGMEEEEDIKDTPPAAPAAAAAAAAAAARAPAAPAAAAAAGKTKAPAAAAASSKKAPVQAQEAPQPQAERGRRGRASGGKGSSSRGRAAAAEEEEGEEEDGMSLEDRLIESLAAEVRAHQQQRAAGPGADAPSRVDESGPQRPGPPPPPQQQQEPALVDPSFNVPTGGNDDEEQMALLESLPDYPRDDPRHRIKERHVGWDGALEGYTLEDGTYVNVKEDPRMTDKERKEVEGRFRRELLRWEAEYPEQWQELMEMCDAAATRKAAVNVAAAVAGRTGADDDEEEEEGDAGARTTPLLASSSVVGKTEEAEAAARALEKQVQAIEQLEGERRLAALPMAERVEEWEAARMAQAVAVDVIDTSKAKGGKKRAKEAAAAASASAPAVEEEAEEEEEEEYVPIDAMFRDELDVNTADGASMRAYLVSSKLAQKFWRRKERPVVLLLTDDRGWRSVQTRKLADHVAFLTNHVVLVPDLYRGDGWEPQTHTQANNDAQALMEFRARHPPIRLLQDAKAAMEALVRNYNATSTGVIGFGVGGGQALSAVASGFMKADAVVAICPVGHDASRVAGAMRTPTLLVAAGENSAEAPLADVVTLMEGFAEKKALPYMIRVFKDCHPGFVTRPKRGEEARAEDAVMLATSWLEIQMRNGGRAKLIRDSRVI